jgi:hypothetical protein
LPKSSGHDPLRRILPAPYGILKAAASWRISDAAAFFIRKIPDQNGLMADPAAVAEAALAEKADRGLKAEG